MFRSATCALLVLLSLAIFSFVVLSRSPAIARDSSSASNPVIAAAHVDAVAAPAPAEALEKPSRQYSSTSLTLRAFMRMSGLFAAAALAIALCWNASGVFSGASARRGADVAIGLPSRDWDPDELPSSSGG